MLESKSIQSWDGRRDLIIPGDADQTIAFAAEHWIHTARRIPTATTRWPCKAASRPFQFSLRKYFA